MICHWCNKDITKDDITISINGEIGRIVRRVYESSNEVKFHYRCWNEFNYLPCYIQHDIKDADKVYIKDKMQKKLSKSALAFYLSKVFVLEFKRETLIMPSAFDVCPKCGSLKFYHTGNMAEYPECYMKTVCNYCHHTLWLTDNSLPVTCYQCDDYNIY